MKSEIIRKRTVLITGGTRGIGRALVYEFAENGFNIAFCYRQSENLAAEICRELQAKEINCIGVKCDVSDYGEVQEMYKAFKRHFGFIDTLINNAGVAHKALFTDDKEADFDYVIKHNLKSVYNVTSNFVPDMVKEKFGRVINISSVWGITGAACEVIYSAAKAGVLGFTKALAQELAPSDVTVNAIAAGLIDTDMNSDTTDKEKLDFLQNVPLGKIGQPSDVASAALYLANAPYVTGEVLKVAGGI